MADEPVLDEWVGDRAPLPKVWTVGVALDLSILLISVVGMLALWIGDDILAQRHTWTVGDLLAHAAVGALIVVFTYRTGAAIEEHLIARRLWFLRNVETLRHPSTEHKESTHA